MIDNKLKQYIESALRRGYSLRDIERALLQHGHKPETIYEHVNYALQNKKSDKFKKLFLISLVISLALLGILIYMVQTFIVKDAKVKSDRLVLQGKNLCDAGNYESGIAVLNEAALVNNNSIRAFGVLGYCYLMENKSIEAIWALTEAFKRGSLEPVHFYRIGVAYCNEHNYALGILNLKRSIELSPTNPDYYEDIINCYAKSGDLEQASFYRNILNQIKTKLQSQQS